MLSKFIINSYEGLLELSIWLVVIVGTIAGFASNGLVGGLIAFVCALIFCTVFYGAFLTLIDIRKTLKSIETTLKQNQAN